MRTITFIICFFMIIGCEQESNDIQKTYSFDSFETGRVRVFTNTGEIENDQLSLNFIDRWENYFYKKDFFKFEDFDFKGQITLKSNNQADIIGSDTIITLGFKHKNGVIYFESADTAYSNSDLINMKDRRLIYGPITQTGIKEGISMGFPIIPNYIYGYLPCVYAIDMGDEIKFPFVSFLEKHCYAENSGSLVGNCNYIDAFSNVNNRVNEYYVNLLKNRSPIHISYENRDTIVFQENFIVFKKQ